MIATSRKSASRPAISRQYEFSRLQDQTLASAYEALIPVVTRQTRMSFTSTRRPRSINQRAAIPSTLSSGSLTAMSTYRSTSPSNDRRSPRARFTPGFPRSSKAKEQTIASQIEVLKRRIADDGLECDAELCFVDDGYSGSSLIRPALDRLRDQAAAGAIDRLYVLSPDRLSRKYAYQVLMLEELVRCGVEVVFLNNPLGKNPEENLLLQVQGMIAEYERAKIMERSRRGKQHAARRGSVSVFSGAPYGYRYVSKHEGDGEARFQSRGQ